MRDELIEGDWNLYPKVLPVAHHDDTVSDRLTKPLLTAADA